MTNIQIYWIGLIILILAILLIKPIRNIVRNMYSKNKRIVATYIHNNMVIYKGITYPINMTKMDFSKNVFTKYYADYKEQQVLEYVPETGFILTDEKTRPKFYYEDEVYLTTIDNQITGYLYNEIFYALHC